MRYFTSNNLAFHILTQNIRPIHPLPLRPTTIPLQVRDWIVPVNRRHKLPVLMDLLRRHYGSRNSGGRRVLVEYTMLAGVNDSLEDAARLLELLEGVEAKVGEGF